MFNFFQSIFEKVVSLVASAIIAVGLVSVPVTQAPEREPEQIEEKIKIEKPLESAILNPQPSPQIFKSQPKQTIERQNVSPQESPANAVITLPNGAVVEIDTTGKILKYLKESPRESPISTPQSPSITVSQQQNFTTPIPAPPGNNSIQTTTTPGPVALQPLAEPLKITDVSLTPGETSALINWKTNKISESSVEIQRIDENNNSIFIIELKSVGLNHSVEVRDLRPNTQYAYSIHAKLDEQNSIQEPVKTFFISPSSRFQLTIKPISHSMPLTSDSYGPSGIPIFETTNWVRRVTNLNAVVELINPPVGLTYPNMYLNGAILIPTGATSSVITPAGVVNIIPVKYTLVMNGSLFPLSSTELINIQNVPHGGYYYDVFQIKITFYGADFLLRCPYGIQYCVKSDFIYPTFPITTTITISPN